MIDETKWNRLCGSGCSSCPEVKLNRAGLFLRDLDEPGTPVFCLTPEQAAALAPMLSEWAEQHKVTRS